MYKIKQYNNSVTGRKNKIYVCTYPDCKREFYKKWNCTEHYKTHTKEKPFECFVCGMYFAQKGSLFKHIKAKSKRGDDHGYSYFMDKYHGKKLNEIA